MVFKVLVTGVGGPAALAIFKVLLGRRDVELYAADMSPLATGMHLVDRGRRVVVPAGGDAAFVDVVAGACARWRIDAIIPTVDAEMLPLARAEARFRTQGVRLALGSYESLVIALDKWRLARAMRDIVRVPMTKPVHRGMNMRLPVIVKPRSGSGSRGVRLIEDEASLARLGTRMDHVAQTVLPGAEYTVDVMADAHGRVFAAVPRERLAVDSGVAIAARTVANPIAIAMAKRVVERLALPFVSNVQLKRDAQGQLNLLEVNPRFAGTSPLTVAAGVNLPELCLRALRGDVLPRRMLPFDEVGVVRYLAEHLVSARAFDEERLLLTG